MKYKDPSRIFAILALVVLILLVAIGVNRAFSRGANDFAVFFEAWRLVLAGHGAEIYRVSPDRFLYSPGFAWLLAPLGIFSKSTSLAIWCFLKICLLIFFVITLSEPWRQRTRKNSVSLGITAGGIILIARPLLIDLEYGQVNLFILGACLWGLLGHFESKVFYVKDFIRWYLLTFAAIAKLFPLPLLLVPWIVTQGVSIRKLKLERLAIFIGLGTALLIPVLSEGWVGTWNLLLGWRDALLARGLPLESHNQSFTALIYHYLSGNSTHVISEGRIPLLFGFPWLDEVQIGLLSLFWTFFTMGITLAWVVVGSNHHPEKWIPIMIGLLIVPSHLIWKPYFVMSLPLAVLILHQSVKNWQDRRWMSVLLVFLLFVGINMTGFDFVGHHWAAHFEAASLLLIVHLLMIWIVARTKPLPAIH